MEKSAPTNELLSLKAKSPRSKSPHKKTMFEHVRPKKMRINTKISKDTELLMTMYNTFTRTYGIAYIVTIAPKLIKLIMEKGNMRSKLNPIKTLMIKHTKSPFPKFLLILFGGFQALEYIFQFISKRIRKMLKFKTSVKSEKRAAALAAFCSSSIALYFLEESSRSDVVLFAFVRAGDMFLSKLDSPQWINDALPAIIFQLSTWQIMYSWFYYPETLPS